MSNNKSIKIDKLKASDFADDSYIKAEQGVFVEAIPSIVRADLGVTSASDVESGDFIQSDGTNWVPKSVPEMKALLDDRKLIGSIYYDSGAPEESLVLYRNDFGSINTWDVLGTPKVLQIEFAQGTFDTDNYNYLNTDPYDYSSNSMLDMSFADNGTVSLLSLSFKDMNGLAIDFPDGYTINFSFVEIKKNSTFSEFKDLS